METVFDARDRVGTGFPPEEGSRLADVLLAEGPNWDNLSLDLRRCSPSLLISAFFNAFLQRIYEKRPDLLEKARAIKWRLAYPFQKKNVAAWMADFKPYSAS